MKPNNLTNITGSKKRQLQGILAVSLLRSLTFSLLSPIIALFLKQFVGTDEHVSIVVSVSYFLGMFSTIAGSWLFSKISRRTGMVITLVLYGVFLISTIIAQSTLLIISFYILYTFLFSLLQLGISQYIDHLSTRRNIATHFGENGMLVNIGWALGPIIGGFLVESFSFHAVFYASAIAVFAALIIFITAEPKDLSPVRDYTQHHRSLIKKIRTYFQHPFLRKMYINVLGFNIYYGALFLAPLFFQELGASFEQIGLYFGLMAIPWILLELPIGKLADKKKNEKHLFVMAYSILLISIFFLGRAQTPSFGFIFLLVSAVATSLIEYTIFGYYYRFVPESEEDMTGIFLTHPNVGIFIGSLLPAVALLMMPYATYVSIVGMSMVLFLINALRLRAPTKRFTADT